MVRYTSPNSSAIVPPAQIAVAAHALSLFSMKLPKLLQSPRVPRWRKLGFEPLETRALLSLTHLYTFNDGTANDSVGSAHGTLMNGATVLDQQLALQNTGITSGQAGTVQHVQLPTNILSGTEATVEVWYAAADSSNWSRVFDFGNQTGGNGDTYLFYTQQSGAGDSRAALNPSSGTERTVTTDTSDDGAQHMAAVVIDTSRGLLRLYVDGEQKSTTTLSGSNASSINDTLNYLGRSLFNGDPGYTGLIDEVRIYDHAVPAVEIAQQAAEGPTVVRLPGDYDNSGTVDDNDYDVWRTNLGSTTNLAADGNGDNVVDAADYIVWRNNQGDTNQEPADQQLHNQAMSVGSLTNTIIELTGDAELHITGTNNPIAGSEIRLNSADAWLFFPNVKPSEVNANYLSQIRVNGAAAFPGISVRVVQHELGTVVIPHGYDFQPFEAFTGPQFTGESQTFEEYTY